MRPGGEFRPNDDLIAYVRNSVAARRQAELTAAEKAEQLAEQQGRVRKDRFFRANRRYMSILNTFVEPIQALYRHFDVKNSLQTASALLNEYLEGESNPATRKSPSRLDMFDHRYSVTEQEPELYKVLIGDPQQVESVNVGGKPVKLSQGSAFEPVRSYDIAPRLWLFPEYPVVIESLREFGLSLGLSYGTTVEADSCESYQRAGRVHFQPTGLDRGFHREPDQTAFRHPKISVPVRITKQIETHVVSTIPEDPAQEPSFHLLYSHSMRRDDLRKTRDGKDQQYSHIFSPSVELTLNDDQTKLTQLLGEDIVREVTGENFERVRRFENIGFAVHSSSIRL